MTSRDPICECKPRLLRAAKGMMKDARITRHVVDSRAHYSGGGTIHAPVVRNIYDLYAFAHECGHAAHGHRRNGPRWLCEYQAERWAHDAFQRYAIKVSKVRTQNAKRNVRDELSAAWDFSPEQTAREAAEWSGGKLPTF